ncbi:aminodeoxychorismate synthase component I [Paenibacillus sp. S33]
MGLDKGSIHIRFRDQSNKIHEYFFKDPIDIIETYDLKSVKDCLTQSEQASAKGYYVVGFVSYEAASAFDERLETQYATRVPLVWFGIYDKKQDIQLFDNYIDDHYQVGEWIADNNYKEFEEHISNIKSNIKKGNTYQTNYTIRLKTTFDGSAASLYKELCSNQKAAYSAYICLGDIEVLSVSPELFFEYRKNRIVTKPMKGTIARGRWHEEDIAKINELRNTPKEQAENIMIVDLLRNDLGRIARTNTVQVTKLFEVEKYPNVFQMTSEIIATTNVNLVKIFESLFPCGSVTGAPKISTMKLIKELEKEPRGIYCGTIGLLLPYNHYIFNVSIRTVVVDKLVNKAIYGVGSGITWDSSVDGEYRELLQKASILKKKHTEFQIIDRLRLDCDHYNLLESHLENIKNTADYFDYPYDHEQLKSTLMKIKDSNNGVQEVYIQLFRDGKIQVRCSPLKLSYEIKNAKIVGTPADRNNVFQFHKTSYLNLSQSINQDSSDVSLFYNMEHEITQFCSGNVVVKLGGNYITPPIECGVIQGTFRDALLKQGKITERKILASQLKRAQEIWLINSVDGWVKVAIDKRYYEFLEA